MATVQTLSLFSEEIAEFIAGCPSRAQILAFQPSAQVQQRASELLNKLREDQLSAEEQQELDQYEQAELIMQLVKARLHAQKTPQP